VIQLVTGYFSRLFQAFGAGWTRFWFTPGDARTVSAIRLLTGLVAVYLHATLAFDLLAFFGPNGLIPAAEIAPLEGDTFSYLNYLTTPAELWLVHVIGLAVLVLFTAGFKTRITSILALVVFLSDIHRAPMITGRAEMVIAMLLCYLCLAPCGRYYSLDALFARKRSKTLPQQPEELSTTAIISTRLIQLHLVLLVAMMALSQLAGDVWWDGLGVWWLITREQSRLVNLSWLRSSPQFLDFWTHAIVGFELCFALLIWIPLARPLLLAAGAVIWTSLALVTGDITFALSLMIASLAFVSPSVLGACCGNAAQPARA